MLDGVTLDQLRAFVTVAESGSFRAGARRLSRVQSAISVAVANLEAQLGVQLFDRSGHRPALTPEGHALLTNARDIILRLDAMRARARGLGEGIELELSIVADVLYPIEDIGTAIARMREVYPSVTAHLSIEALGGPLEALLKKRCSLAIMVGEDFRDPRIALQSLSAVQLMAVVATGHELASNMEDGLDIPDLAGHPQIVLSDPSPFSEGRDFGVISPHVCRVSTLDAKRALVLAGVGWTRLPLWQIRRDLEEGRLKRLATTALGRGSQITSEAYLAHRLDEPLGPAARALADALTGLADRP